jgi:hypothetical protein
MDIWRKFAFRHFKKSEPLTFAFEVKTLPDDIAEGIRCGLEVADSEDAIKQAFEIDAIATVEKPVESVKSDYAILELADAINKACEIPPEVKAEIPQPHFTFNMADMVKAVMPEQVVPTVTVNNLIPESPAPVVNVSVEPTPVSITNDVKPADVVIKKDKAKPVKLEVNRNIDGVITGIQEK